LLRDPMVTKHEIPPATELNRVVWVLWLQGFENSPEVVQLCRRSWKIRNPTWQVVELSLANLSNYIDADSLGTLLALDIPPQKLANLIRLYLISRHGGVWADATCFCVQPLDHWIHGYMDSGFFAFRFPAAAWLDEHMDSVFGGIRDRSGDRILSNWFLAAVKGNLLASTFYEAHRGFFLKYSFPLQNTEKGRKRIERLEWYLNRNAKRAQWWTLPLVVKAAKVFPFYIFHYHFARTITKNAACREIWNRTPTFPERGPHKFTGALVSPITDEQLYDLTNAVDPLYKLTWKYDTEAFSEGCVFDHLKRSLADEAV